MLLALALTQQQLLARALAQRQAHYSLLQMHKEGVEHTVHEEGSMSIEFMVVFSPVISFFMKLHSGITALLL